MIAYKKRIKYSVLILAFVFSSIMAFGQEATPKNNKANRTSKLIQEKAGRPDIPGDLMIEFGFNWVQEHPPGIGFNTTSSRTFNAYYLYEKNIGESAFSIHPGIGIGTEKYAFVQDLTLGHGFDSLGNKEVQFVSLDSIYGIGTSYKKSQINPNYVDIPIEIRWRSRKYDPKRSLKVTLGGKVGFLFDSKTKVKYTEDGEAKKTKQKEKFELSTIRYGAFAKIGFGGFSAYYYYSISDLFKKDKGPLGTTMYPMTFGISYSLF
ncbi:MAG: PorT family protein [Cyclobacteriaceae bacterium]|nr:PorT family protein [Cyclobacteriaceae bacterium]MCK5471114.1 PorT family protein [Cyclobacteriaceae bacterium]